MYMNRCINTSYPFLPPFRLTVSTKPMSFGKNVSPQLSLVSFKLDVFNYLNTKDTFKTFETVAKLCPIKEKITCI